MAKSFLSEKLAVVLLRAAPWSLMRQNLLKIWVPENPGKQTSFFVFLFFCFFQRTVHRLQRGFERISTINLEKTNMLRKKNYCRKLLNLFHQSESSEEFFEISMMARGAIGVIN